MTPFSFPKLSFNDRSYLNVCWQVARDDEGRGGGVASAHSHEILMTVLEDFFFGDMIN